MLKIIIPTAKVVSEELKKLGELPPLIYPLGKGIVFDYLIEQFKNLAPTYNIICFEEAHKVEKKLMKYNNIFYKILVMDSLGDLGESIYHGIKDELNQEIIINFADTLIMDQIDDTPKDCIFYAEDYVSNLWTFFESDDGLIKNVIDKKNSLDSKEKKKLFVGLFRISKSSLFKRFLFEGIKNKKDMDSFYYAIVKYSQMEPFSIIETKNWYDIGHAQKYVKSNLEVKAREYNSIQIDRDRGILKKESSDIDKFIGEILWYLRLPSNLQYVRPRIFNYSTNYLNTFIEMEYYPYHTLHELFVDGDLTFNQWMTIFNKIKFILKDFQKFKLINENPILALKDIYLTKTINRMHEIKSKPEFNVFFINSFIVNDIKYKSLNEILKILEYMIPKFLYNKNTFNIIHGDMCFSNILIDNNLSIVKLIDPRGSFGEFDIYGDSRYELAKLIHSVDGKYDYIIRDKFELEVYTDKPSIKYSLIEENRSFDLYDCFKFAFQEEMEYEKSQIELIEGLLFFSMLPLHNENIKRQYAMIATGIKILDRLIDIRN